MLTSDYDKHICDKYRTTIENNKSLQCRNCPLMIDYEEGLCKAIAHYDKTRGKWVLDN